MAPVGDPSTRRERRTDAAYLGALLTAWTAAALLVDPRAALPLNDDWAYAHVVRTGLETGRLAFTDWQSMPLLTHTVWGALFCLPFGFSMTALRVSSLAAGFLGGVGVYALLRELGARPGRAAVGAAVLLTNPIYFGLSYTYMTDVPFVAVLVSSLWLWTRGLARRDRVSVSLGIVLAVFATMSRQLGVAVPLAFGVAALLTREARSARGIARALAPIALSAAALVSFERVAEATVGLPALYHAKEESLGQALLDLTRLRGLPHVALNTVVGLAYVGLGTLPFALVTLPREASRRRLAVGLVGSAILAAAFVSAGLSMPMTGNVFLGLGVGPRTVPGAPGPAMPWLSRTLTFAAMAGAVLLAPALVRAALAPVSAALRTERPAGGVLPRRFERIVAFGRSPRITPVQAATLLGVIAFLHIPPAIGYDLYFDRYALPMIPPALALLCAQRGVEPKPWQRALAACLVAASAAFSIAATHDYLAWQRARWALAQELDAAGVAPADRHGGFEVDHYGPEAVPRKEAERDGARFTLAAAPLDGNRVVRTHRVETWLPGGIESHPPARPRRARRTRGPSRCAYAPVGAR